MFQPKPVFSSRYGRQPVGHHQERHEQEHRRGRPGALAGPAPAGAAAGTGAVATRSSDARTPARAPTPPRSACRGGQHLERPPPARRAPAARRGRGARTAGARSSRSSSRARTDPTRSATHTPTVGGRKSTNSAASTDEKSKNWWVRSSASTAWKARPTTTPRFRVRRNTSSHGMRQLDHGRRARSRPTASPAAPSSWSAESPSESVDSSEVEGGAAHRAVEERRVELGERREEVEAEQAQPSDREEPVGQVGGVAPAAAHDPDRHARTAGPGRRAPASSQWLPSTGASDHIVTTPPTARTTSGPTRPGRHRTAPAPTTSRSCVGADAVSGLPRRCHTAASAHSTENSGRASTSVRRAGVPSGLTGRRATSGRSLGGPRGRAAAARARRPGRRGPRACRSCR